MKEPAPLMSGNAMATLRSPSIALTESKSLSPTTALQEGIFMAATAVRLTLAGLLMLILASCQSGGEEGEGEVASCQPVTLQSAGGIPGEVVMVDTPMAIEAFAFSADGRYTTQ